MKKIIGILICLLLVVTACGKSDTPEGPKTPPPEIPNSSIEATQVIEGIEFSGMTLESDGDSTKITINVRNTTGAPLFLSIFGFELVNDDDAFIYGTQVGGKELEPGEKWLWENTIELDVTHATNVKFEVSTQPITPLPEPDTGAE